MNAIEQQTKLKGIGSSLPVAGRLRKRNVAASGVRTVVRTLRSQRSFRSSLSSTGEVKDNPNGGDENHDAEYDHRFQKMMEAIGEDDEEFNEVLEEEKPFQTGWYRGVCEAFAEMTERAA